MYKQNIILDNLEELLNFIKSNDINKVTIKTHFFSYHYENINFFMSSIENNIIMNKDNKVLIVDFKREYPYSQNIVLEWVL